MKNAMQLKALILILSKTIKVSWRLRKTVM